MISKGVRRRGVYNGELWSLCGVIGCFLFIIRVYVIITITDLPTSSISE